jgi:putative transposase
MGRPMADGRLMLEGIAWRCRTGVPWRDLPDQFGPWRTVWKHHHRFSFDGTYQRMLDVVCSHFELAAESDESDDLDVLLERLFSVDSTVVRAHQHAAGVRRVPGREAAALACHTGG